MKITKDTTLEKILQIKGAEEVLAKNNVPCLLCPYSKIEMSELKIGDICKMYGLNFKKILADLNKL